MQIIKQEKKTEELFDIEDNNERNLFENYTAAVKSSHEKEKIYANTVKYWSIIGSILGKLTSHCLKHMRTVKKYC